MLKLFKREYRFDVKASENIRIEEIKDIPSLTNYVIGVNNEMIDLETEGWLNVSKSFVGKKGDTTLFAIGLEFPIYEDAPYFEQLLAPFQTTKPIPFEEPHTPVVQNNVTSSDSEEIMENTKHTQEVLPDELLKLVTEGSTFLNSPSVEEIQEQNEEPIQEVIAASSETPVQNEQVEILQKMLAEKSAEIEQLKETINTKENIETKLVASGTVENYDPKTFIQTEMDKLKTELTQVDTRSSISERVSKRIAEEKNIQIEAISNTLLATKNERINEENIRHQEALIKIEATYTSDKNSELQQVEENFENKYQNEVASEYKQQSLFLENYINERKQKIVMQQKELTSQLENQFNTLNASFNIISSNSQSEPQEIA